MFEPTRKEMAGWWRRLHNEELHNLYASHIFTVMKLRRMRWAGHVAHMGEMRNVYKILVKKPVGKKLLGRCRHRWEDNFRTHLRGTQWKGGTGFMWLSSCGHGNEPLGSIKSREF
jgi:hypothetical protein